MACILGLIAACGGGNAGTAFPTSATPPTADNAATVPVTATTLPPPATTTTAAPTTTSAPTTTTTLVPGVDWRDAGTIPFTGDIVRLAEAPFGLVGVAIGGTYEAPELALATKLPGSPWQVNVRPTRSVERSRYPALVVKGDTAWVWSVMGTFRSTDGITWEELPAVTCIDQPLPPRNQPHYAYRCEPLWMVWIVGDAFIGVSPGQWGREYDTGDRTDAYWTSSDGLTWEKAPILPEDKQRTASLRGHQFEIASIAVVDDAIVALRSMDPTLLVAGSDGWTEAPPLPIPDGYVASPSSSILYLGSAIANGAAGPIVATTLDDSEGMDRTAFIWIRDASGNWSLATSAHVSDVQGAVAGPAGYVVLVVTTENRLEVWTSPDGVQWLTTPLALSAEYNAQLIVTSTGFAIASGPGVYMSP
jgi:hypothetical protein